MSKPTESFKVTGIHTPGACRDIAAPRTLSTAPLCHSVTVSWGDCDPAQIAYTANIPGWGLLAIEAWYRQILGADWYALNLEYGTGTPFVALDFQFKSPVRPGASLEIKVYVKRIGNSSLHHYVEAKQDDSLRFIGNTSAVFVDARTMQSISIPPNMRSSIERYSSDQGNQFVTGTTSK